MITPTQLIYHAWRNTPKIMQNTRDAKGNEITRELEFIDPLKHKDIEDVSGLCVLCGQPMTKGMRVNKIFSDVFTDWGYCQNIAGTHVCESCCFCVLTNPNGRQAIRSFSIVAADRLHVANRQELRKHLLEPPDPPFVIILAVSQKKHLAFKSMVSYSRDQYLVQYEETPVPVVRSELNELLQYIDAMLAAGFTKTEIESGKYRQDRVLRFGIHKWEMMDNQIKHHRGSLLLSVAMFVAQPMSEEELTCFLASKLPTTIEEQPPSLSMSSTAAAIKSGGHKDSTCGGKSKDSVGPARKEPEQLVLF